MPQDGSNNYQYPPGTPGIPDQTIQSESYNTFLDDLVNNDLNIPRPITRGGTGASDSTQALVNLGGEKSSQVVTNYDTQVFLSGSFYSAAGATNAPVAGHAFVGFCYSSDPPATPPANLNLVIQARDQNDTAVPGKLYIREKKAGVWSTWQGESSLNVGSLPPNGAPAGALWWDSDNGVLYVNYKDVDTTQWVQAVALPAVDTSLFVKKNGDTMNGFLTLSGDPTAILHAATKQYVDGGVGGVGGGLAAKVSKAGDTMTGDLKITKVNSILTLDKLASGQYSILSGSTNNSLRWSMQLGDGTAEAGGNAGSDFYLIPCTDAGAGSAAALSILRSTGLATVKADPTAALGVATKQYVDAKSPIRYDLGGLTLVDIPVPASARAARITGSLLPTTVTAVNFVIQPSVSSGVFLSTPGQFGQTGHYTDSLTNGTTAMTPTDVSRAGYLLTNSHSNISLPAFFDAVVVLRRPSTSVNFTCSGRGAAFVTSSASVIHGNFYNYMTIAAAAGVLQILALRLTGTPALTYQDNSYVTVEWL